MTDVQMKKNLRKTMLIKRQGLSNTYCMKASKDIFEQFQMLSVYCDADNICLYVPIRNEVDFFQFRANIIADGKKIFLPRVIGKQMEFYRYTENTLLTEGAYHIPEPVSDDRLNPEEVPGVCLIVMPGAVFSKEKDRIGYGGGFYDRYLAKHINCKTVAIGYEMQVVDHIPAEATDIKPDIILYNHPVES